VKERVVMSVSLLPRLDILREGGILSDENYERVLSVISHFKNRYGIELTEENASAFITHLCSALQRITNGEPVEALDKDIYEDVIIQPTFERANEISTELRDMYPIIPESELMYLNMHLNILLETEEDSEA